MADAKQIFDALMIEALSDIRSAKLLLDGTEFSRSIYHSYSVMPNIQNLIRDAKYLERQATKSRYPLFTNPDRPIWIPSREYTEQDAADAYRKAIAILKAIKQFLKEKHSISSIDLP